MSEKTTLEVLKTGRERISDPADWSRYMFAESVDGNNLCDGFADGAVKWCGLGAIEYATGEWFSVGASAEPHRLLNLVSNELYPGMSLIEVNTDLGHEAMLAVYDEAIRREEAKS